MCCWNAPKAGNGCCCRFCWGGETGRDWDVDPGAEFWRSLCIDDGGVKTGWEDDPKPDRYEYQLGRVVIVCCDESESPNTCELIEEFSSEGGCGCCRFG